MSSLLIASRGVAMLAPTCTPSRYGRLVLVEALDLAVQADVRLGLAAPRAAIAVAALPRGNQVPASAVVIRRGLTVQQTERMVAELLDQPEAARTTWIAQRLESALVAPARRAPRRARPRIAAHSWAGANARARRWGEGEDLECQPCFPCRRARRPR